MAGEGDGGAAAGSDADEVEHTNVIYSGTLPPAAGSVPGVLHATAADDLRKQAIEFYSFLTTPGVTLSSLNADFTPRVALVQIPRTKMVRVVYSPGFGMRGLGGASPIDDKVLVLTGDGNATSGPPTQMMLPPSVVDVIDVHRMTLAQFSEKLTAQGDTYAYPLAPRSQCTTTSSILRIAPIPAFVVFDGFHHDLDAADVLERILTLDVDGVDMYKHAIEFLLTVLSGQYSAEDKPYLAVEEIFQPCPPEARNWAIRQFRSHFPTLQAAAPAASQITPSPSSFSTLTVSIKVAVTIIISLTIFLFNARAQQ